MIIIDNKLDKAWELSEQIVSSVNFYKFTLRDEEGKYKSKQIKKLKQKLYNEINSLVESEYCNFAKIESLLADKYQIMCTANDVQWYFGEVSDEQIDIKEDNIQTWKNLRDTIFMYGLSNGYISIPEHQGYDFETMRNSFGIRGEEDKTYDILTHKDAKRVLKVSDMIRCKPLMADVSEINDTCDDEIEK